MPPPQELSRDVTPPVIVSSLVAEKKEQKHPEQGGKTEVGREHIEKAKGEEKPKGEDKPRREQDKTKNSEQLKKKGDNKNTQTNLVNLSLIVVLLGRICLGNKSVMAC